MNENKLRKLIKKNEYEKLDFKLKIELFTENVKKELAKDICAIANSRGGRGYIIIGVEDKTKKIVGVDADYITEERVQQIVASRIEPPVPISLEECFLDGKRLLVIVIFNSYQKPYQIRENGAFYIRRGSTTDIMRKQELLSEFQKGISFNLETCPIVNSNIDFLNEELVKRYFYLKGIKISKENREFLLSSSNIIHKNNISGKSMCTLGGLLVFSDVNSIYIPHNMIKIRNLLGGEQTFIIRGNILDMMKSMEKKLREIVPNEYPVALIIDTIRNILIYRDYSQYNKIVEVVLGKKELTVYCPGEIVKRYRDGRIGYIKRNMWIYEKIISLDSRGGEMNYNLGEKEVKESFTNKVKVITVNEENITKFIFNKYGTRN
ncbi:helix-turn-helix domain-containing protein [Clostridium perfringens]|uniref:AlbA family DNA-binding domain-containing protein n=1 Tax=Clostridium perfringens TaxID=1502 RepID=UPI0022E43574|nr:RNA-binding domain-containing protein [Clostridium perfringens]